MSTPTPQSPAQPAAMRSVPDRVRHALLFEILALAIVIPVGGYLFNLQESAMGVIGLGSAITATVWNYCYNHLFDHTMVKLFQTTQKTVVLRVIHTCLFEAGLQIVLLPSIALYLRTSLAETVSLTLSIALFYLVYAFFFNWAYDRLFPIPFRPAASGQQAASL